jgi:hypothetical protein
MNGLNIAVSVEKIDQLKNTKCYMKLVHIFSLYWPPQIAANEFWSGYTRDCSLLCCVVQYRKAQADGTILVQVILANP